MKFVSFVVATYNCLPHVEAFSKMVQTFDREYAEFVICDGGSTDGTIEYLSQLGNVTIAYSCADEGIYDAWNKGIKYCSGTYVSFIGVDDFPEINFIKKAISITFKERSYPKILYGNAEFVYKERSRYKVFSEKPELFFSDNPVFDLPHPGLLNHSSLFKTARFSSNYKLAGDLEFYLSLRGNIKEKECRYIDCKQATIGADGLSRSVNASKIYLKEYKLLEKESGVKLGYSYKKLKILSLLEFFPAIFNFLKKYSWLLRGERRSNFS